MKRLLRSRFLVVCAAAIVTAFVVGGVAWAVQSPVDGDGVIHACYNPKTGVLHLNVTGSCPKSGQKIPISWSEQGDPGQQGPKGDVGPQGIPGEAGPLSDYSVVRLQADIGPDGATFDVECPHDHVVLGSGYYFVSNTTHVLASVDDLLVQSIPQSQYLPGPPPGWISYWRLAFRGNPNESYSGFVYATCAAAAPPSS